MIPPASRLGLSDACTSPDKRKLLDLIGKLGEIGAGIDVSLPTILPVGGQSSGKSSVLEGVTGIAAFPRGNGTCTRSPLECQLRRTKGPREFAVFLRTIFDQRGRPLGQARSQQFGDVMHDEKDIPNRVERAHRAILSPSTDYRVFLESNAQNFPSRELDFTKNSVLLRISGPDVEDLSICDLPGLFVDPGKNGNANDVDLVKNLVSDYIRNPACIILLTVSCETDPQNQGAPQLVRGYDRDWSRTIGVLTMPDRMRAGTGLDWLQYLQGNTVPLKHGWFCVRRPDFNDIEAGMTRNGALQKEAETFSSPPWSSLGVEKERLGIDSLRLRLSELLAGLIFQMLPDIRRDVDKQLDETNEELQKLPEPPSSDPVLEISSIVTAFSVGLNSYVEGPSAGANRPVQKLRDLCDVCHKAILDTEPVCRPHDRPAGEHGLNRTSTTHSRDGPKVSPSADGPDDNRVIYLDDVMKRMDEARVRELPNHWPDSVAKEYIRDIIDEWLAPVKNLFREYSVALGDGLGELVDAHFGRYPYLRDRVRKTTATFLRDLAQATRLRIKDLLEMEKLVQTVHGRYLEAFDKYNAKFANSAPTPPAGTTVMFTAGASIDTFKSSTHRSSTSGVSSHTSAAAGFQASASYHPSASNDTETKEGNVKRARIDSAREVMASVSAYFEVSHERFTDNVRNVVDFYFVLGLVRGQALVTALYKDLGIGSPDARARCAEFFREPPDIAERRESLMKKQERLQKAQELLANAAI